MLAKKARLTRDTGELIWVVRPIAQTGADEAGSLPASNQAQNLSTAKPETYNAGQDETTLRRNWILV